MADFTLAPINVTTADLAQTLGIVYVVRELAAHDPYGTPVQNPPVITRRDADHCAFCDEHRDDPHDPVCLWWRAKQIVDSGVLDGRTD